jgi:hypothetical protein
MTILSTKIDEAAALYHISTANNNIVAYYSPFYKLALSESDINATRTSCRPCTCSKMSSVERSLSSSHSP